MRDIQAEDITATVARLCQEANYYLPQDLLDALERASLVEESDLGRQVLGQIVENARLAAAEQVPICQDTGISMVYVELGQEVHVTGGDLYAAIQQGVRGGYEQGYLRKSMVERPFSGRENTGDNTPAVIHMEKGPGDRLKITVVPKGAGSENMSRLFMLTPSAGRQGIIDAVVRAVDEAGSNPCPPLIVGVGIGGSAEKAMDIAKRALLRPVGQPHADPETAQLEDEILHVVNKLGIGPQGFGGRITALAVHVETFPAHIGGLPLAGKFGRHAPRHKEAVILPP